MAPQLIDRVPEYRNITAHVWLRGRTDAEVARYVRQLIDKEDLVEFWGYGRDVIRQMKRVGNLIERQGFAVMYEYRPDPRTESKQFGVRFAPSYYDLDGFAIGTRK